MPFKFPPQSSEIKIICGEVENAKSAVGFNDNLRERLLKQINRFSVTDEARVSAANEFLQVIIPENINPCIQRIMLDPSTSATKHIYYQMQSPQKIRKQIDRYGSVSLFNNEERERFEDDVNKICQHIYKDGAALKLKPVSILNFLQMAFWCQSSYLTTPEKQQKLKDTLI